MRQFFSCTLLLIFLFTSQTRRSIASFIRAPSVFRSDESDFHKFSAVVAATEPFRLQCEQHLSKVLSPFSRWKNKFTGIYFCFQHSCCPHDCEQADRLLKRAHYFVTETETLTLRCQNSKVV
jgi:hypothetical protein